MANCLWKGLRSEMPSVQVPPQPELVFMFDRPVVKMGDLTLFFFAFRRFAVG